MACRLIGTNLSFEPMLFVDQIHSENFNENTTISFQENTIENSVCKMASILSRPPCMLNKYLDALYGNPKNILIITVTELSLDLQRV